MGKENCKRPKAEVVKKETDAHPKCKNEPVEPEVDSTEESEPEYELYFKVTEASSGRPIQNESVRIVISEGKSAIQNTDDNGEFQRIVNVNGHTCQLKFESLDPVYKLKVANPSATTKQKGGGPTIIELEKRLLEIVSVDPHFVPTGQDDDENLQIHYHIHGIKSAEDPDPKVYVAIRNQGGWLYRRQLTADEVADGGNKLLKWDGKINHPSSGNLLNKLANPLIGPFDVLLMYDAPTGKIASNREAFNILYHSIKIKPGSYLEDPAVEPTRINPTPADGGPQWVDHIKWVQYRLNKLGYFAGVVNGVLNAQTKRAVKRFTYEMIRYAEADFTHNNEDLRIFNFLKELTAETLKVNLFENESVITDNGALSKIFIQNNYFYHTEGNTGTGDWNFPDGHWRKENDHGSAKGGKLDRFEYPLLAEIKLLSRSGNAADATEAIGDLKIKWTVEAPDADSSNIPQYNGAISPSSAKMYLEKVNADLKAMPGKLGANCPEECGGIQANDPYFTILLPGFTIHAGTNHTNVLSTVCQDATKPEMVGKTGVLFKGSNFGGDTYSIKAEISFQGLANEIQLTTNHASRPVDDMKAQTGKMTVWRKRRITHVIDWQPEMVDPVEWADVVNCFKAAYIDLDVSNVTHDLMKNLVSGADAVPYLKVVAEWCNWNEASLVFSGEYMSPNSTDRLPGESTLNYMDRLSNYDANFQQTRITLGSDNRISMGSWIRGIIRRRSRPGVILIRSIVFKGVRLSPSTFSKKILHGYNQGTSNTGMGDGVAIISEGYRKQLKDGFITAHEIAHCFYLSHPHQVATDHDMGDKNDVMYYLHTGGCAARGVVDLSHNSPNKPLFCGKCLLKLRGWKVSQANAAVATILVGDSTPLPAEICNPIMVFEGYFLKKGGYLADMPGKPNPELITMDHFSFLHKHTMKWESTNGNMATLNRYYTREYITFDKPTQGPPFNVNADPDREFWQEGNRGNIGSGTDNHSVRWPGMIAAYPRVAGTIMGIQKYQYSSDRVNWLDIPGADYILEKTIYHNGKCWVLKFKKTEGPENPNPYFFEVEYKIGDPVEITPRVFPNPDYVNGGPPKPTGVGFAIDNGSHTIMIDTSGAATATDLRELKKLGYLA